ncbi:DUF2332 domain-containing protein [Pseudonocardia xishanensis]
MSTVADEARAIADAWSAPGSPPSWWLTAALFTAVAEDEVLRDIGAGIPADRRPALLLSAAITAVVTTGADPVRRYFPVPGGPQPPDDGGFRPALKALVRDRRDAIAALCAGHRYQMNEVTRSVDVLPVLGAVAAETGRPLALVDLGTGAGLGLRPDRYAYEYTLPDGTVRAVGSGPLTVGCTVRGAVPPLPERLSVTARVGVDVEPSDLEDPVTAAWLAACVPPEAGAVTRFAAAVDLARAEPAEIVRGDVLEVLPAVVGSLPADTAVCLVDTYVHVFLGPERLARFRELVTGLGRDLDWISVDPLVPLGPEATTTVQGLDVPPQWLTENREGGVFGVIGRLSVRDGVASARLLGRAHPGGSWLEWL